MPPMRGATAVHPNHAQLYQIQQQQQQQLQHQQLLQQQQQQVHHVQHQQQMNGGHAPPPQIYRPSPSEQQLLLQVFRCQKNSF